MGICSDVPKGYACAWLWVLVGDLSIIRMSYGAWCTWGDKGGSVISCAYHLCVHYVHFYVTDRQGFSSHKRDKV
jgi:hypothetical protein